MTPEDQLPAAQEAQDRAVRIARQNGEPNLGAFEHHAKKIQDQLKKPSSAPK